jgi:hypothetical protein
MVGGLLGSEAFSAQTSPGLGSAGLRKALLDRGGRNRDVSHDLQNGRALDAEVPADRATGLSRIVSAQGGHRTSTDDLRLLKGNVPAFLADVHDVVVELHPAVASSSIEPVRRNDLNVFNRAALRPIDNRNERITCA